MENGMDVIVVGAGYGGLSCAIECRRKGHRVIIFEKVQELKVLGDSITIGANAGRLLARWGLHDKIWPLCGHVTAIHFHDPAGGLIRSQPWSQPLYGAYAYNGPRALIHDVLVEHAKAIGVDIRLGTPVTDYFEDSDSGRPGVVIEDGRRVEADVIVAADGVKSLARDYILGYHDHPKPSGFAIFRAWFDVKECGVDKDPLTQFLCERASDWYFWIGRDVHMLALSNDEGKTVTWVITHKDPSGELYTSGGPAKLEDALKIIEGWDPRCAALVSKAPMCYDWKLVVHDPLPTWISKGGRVILMGDGAHPFLPSSAQGASQAIEDGVALAVALTLAGKRDVALAAKTWETMRYDRVRAAQQMGESTRDKWHGARVGDKGDTYDLPMPEWLLSFDAEAHAYAEYDKISEDILQNGYKPPQFKEAAKGKL